MTPQSRLTSDQPLRVLTPELRDRLQRATHATRALAAKGYRVIRQDLRLNSRLRPLLVVVNGDEKLRADLTQIAGHATPSGMAVVGKFLDVDLCLKAD